MSEKSQRLLLDDDAVAIDSAFDGDAEEGVIPDFAVVGASGGAEGAAAGEQTSGDESGGDQKGFLHGSILLVWGESTRGIRAPLMNIHTILISANPQ